MEGDSDETNGMRDEEKEDGYEELGEEEEQGYGRHVQHPFVSAGCP